MNKAINSSKNKELINAIAGLKLQLLPFELLESSDRPISNKAKVQASKSFFGGHPVRMKGKDIHYMTKKELLAIIPKLEKRLLNYTNKIKGGKKNERKSFSIR